MDNGATEREEKRDKTSQKDWTEQMKMSLFYSLSISLCCSSFLVCSLTSGEVAKEVMCAVDQDATGSLR